MQIASRPISRDVLIVAFDKLRTPRLMDACLSANIKARRYIASLDRRRYPFDMTSQVRASTVDWLDRTAVAASMACLIHCLALPLLVAAIPALSSLIKLPASLHCWVLTLACPVAVVALVQGRAVHGSKAPLALGAAGLVLIGVGAFALEEGGAETVVTVSGSLALALAHLLNWRLRRRCRG